MSVINDVLDAAFEVGKLSRRMAFSEKCVVDGHEMENLVEALNSWIRADKPRSIADTRDRVVEGDVQAGRHGSFVEVCDPDSLEPGQRVLVVIKGGGE